jgi:hypothetical protein
MKFLRGSGSLGVALLVLGLLSAFMLAGVLPCHADSCQCQGALSHTDCRCHSVPCFSQVNAAPIAALSIAPYHPIEVRLIPKIFACSIFRPPRV